MHSLLRAIRKLCRRIYFVSHRGRMASELAEEMEAHLEMMPSDRRSRFGNTTALREESADVWSWIWLHQFLQDLSYGARTLRKAPAFTLGAALVLALGVGVNLAEFQIFDAMLFHRLHVRDVDSLLQLSRISKRNHLLGFPSGAAEFYRAQNSSFAWLISEETLEATVDADTAQRSSLVSANYFAALGLVPSWGRLLDARDSRPDAPAVVVLGYQYWQTHFAADPHVVGRIVHVNNQPVQIVGVLPYSFDGLWTTRIALWLPVAIRPLILPGSTPPPQDFSRASQELVGKLKSGVSQAAGEAELMSLTRELIRQQPRSFRDDEHIQTQVLQESMAYNAKRSPPVFILIVMILLVLVSACANLGNMLMARGFARRREIDIRLAIGASRPRLVRQLMTENLLLAILGTAAGLAFGAITARLLMIWLDAPPSIRVSIGWPIFFAGFVLTLFSTVAFGLPSALQIVSSKHRKSRLRQILVGLQVAVSCLLLIAVGVLAHSGILEASLDLTFDYNNMVVIYPQLYTQNLPVAIKRQKLDALATRLSGLPGVDAVTLAVSPPLGGRRFLDSLPGLPHIYRNAVATSYFTMMNLPVVRGRTFLPGEQNAVIVSESAARAVWPNQDPVGKIWNLWGAQRTVVGVVKDSGANLLADPESIEAYIPLQGADLENAAIVLHTRGDPGPLMHMVPATAASSNETVSVSLMRSSRDAYLNGMQRLVILLGLIGAVATALAAAGMFALVAFAVAQRKRELGIRLAIGAKPRHILGILLGQNAKPTAAGAIGGAILAVILSRLVRSFIFLRHSETIDIAGFAAGLVCFALVAVLATLSPAMRALRIDPSETLREE
jgi:predicted permease